MWKQNTQALCYLSSLLVALTADSSGRVMAHCLNIFYDFQATSNGNNKCLVIKCDLPACFSAGRKRFSNTCRNARKSTTLRKVANLCHALWFSSGNRSLGCFHTWKWMKMGCWFWKKYDIYSWSQLLPLGYSSGVFQEETLACDMQKLFL